jgi:hypothetical protein
MASIEQINANRENSKHSTGPTSSSGLEISSQNARKHGFTGKSLNLPPDELDPYEKHVAGHLQHIKPVGTPELDLAHSYIDYRWKLHQLNNLEEELYKLGASEGKTRAQFFLERQKEFDRLSRYQTRLQRHAIQDQKKLEELQQARKARETQDFQDAAGLLYQAVEIEKNFDPAAFAKFGFVWSPEEIFEAAERHAAKKEVRKRRMYSEITNDELPK